MPVLSFEDFRTCFVNKNKYGVSPPSWPHETVLVYKCEWDIEVEDMENDWLPNIPWTVVKNTPGEVHSEETMLDQIREWNDDHPEAPHSGSFDLQIYLSYSPCDDCSTKLIQFVEEFDNRSDVKVSIYFGTFYKHYMPLMWEGLLKLCTFNTFMMDKKHKICMYILNGQESWQQFFDDMQVEGEETLWNETATDDERRVLREKADLELFSLLQGPTNLDMDASLQTMNFEDRFLSGFMNSYYCNQTCRHNDQCLGCQQRLGRHFCPHCYRYLLERMRQLQIQV